MEWQEMKRDTSRKSRWVCGDWVSKEDQQSQDKRIEAAFVESKLRHARLELELVKRATTDSAREYPHDAVATEWAENHMASYSDDLLSVLMFGNEEATRLGRNEYHTDAVLLALLGSSKTEDIFSEVPIDGGEPVQTMRSAVEASVRNGKADDVVIGPGPELAFTATLRNLLEMTESERARLGHDQAQPGHLVLALTSEGFVDTSMTSLLELGVDPKVLRPRALESLGGFFASSKSKAEKALLARVDDAQAASLQRRSGQCLPGMLEAYGSLTSGLVERVVEVKLLLLAALAGEHLFLLGAPGTAKSLVARRLADVCRGRFFERLLTRFTVPEEIFGPLSLQALEQDELRRKTQGYMPEADVVFIDEIFKANSSILNALLLILNERCFDNGDVRLNVPLWCAVAASNELPESEELDALYDRFLLRRCVRRVSAGSVMNFMRLILDSEPSQTMADNDSSTPQAVLTRKMTLDLQARARSVDFPEHVLQIVADLREYLSEEAEPSVDISDRRLAKAVQLIRVAAAAVGGTSVVEADLLLLRHIFWDREPEQAELVVDWLLRRIWDDGSDQKAWTFILEGIKSRLRSDQEGPALEAVRRDLGNLHDAAMVAFERQLQITHDLPQQADEGDLDCIDRYFWLAPEERREAASVGKKAKHASDSLGELIVEVAVLQEAVVLENAAERQAVVKHLIGVPTATNDEDDGEVERDEWGDPI